MTYLTGIDISYAQGTTPALGSDAFVVVKATQADFMDPMWHTHSANVRAAAKPLGAYCFGVSGSRTPVATQAELFLATAAGADFLALDLEHDAHWTSSMTVAEAEAFIALVHAAGRKIGLYHSESGFPSCGQDWNWVAYWESIEPPVPWLFWQYAGTGVDHDKFKGDAAALAAFLASQEAEMVPAPILDHTPAIVDIPAAESQYALDAATKVGLTTARTGTLSPFSVRHSSGAILRAIYVGNALFLAAPTKVSAVPAGFTQADLDAAKAAGYSEAKTKATLALQAI